MQAHSVLMTGAQKKVSKRILVHKPTHLKTQLSLYQNLYIETTIPLEDKTGIYMLYSLKRTLS